MRDFLFRAQYFWKQAKNPVVKAIAEAVVPADVAQAIGILRRKWYVIDWEVRMKGLPFLEHRLR